MARFGDLSLYPKQNIILGESWSPCIAFSIALKPFKYINYHRINLNDKDIHDSNTYIGINSNIVTSYLQFDYEAYFKLDNDTSRWNFFISSICESLKYLWEERDWNAQDLIITRDSLLNKENEMIKKIIGKRENGYTLKLWVNYTFRENRYFLDVISAKRKIHKSIFINKGRTGFVQWHFIFNKLLYTDGCFIFKDIHDNTLFAYDIKIDELLDAQGNLFHANCLLRFEHFAVLSEPWDLR